jgi:hypothetical protein
MQYSSANLRARGEPRASNTIAARQRHPPRAALARPTRDRQRHLPRKKKSIDEPKIAD